MAKQQKQGVPNQQLKAQRLQRNWTQAYVAKMVGTTYITMCRWEKGVSVPSLHFRQQLCQLFGLSAEELGLLSSNEEVSQYTSPAGAGQAFPPLWHLPYRRNPFFVGREALLERMHHLFHTEQSTPLAHALALCGLGGIGKTQLAVEYAYRFRHHYQAVLFARAETTSALTDDFITFAHLLDLPAKDAQDQHRVVVAVTSWLSTHSNWLLIMDNVDALPLLQDFLPVESSSHLLFTTRTQITGSLALPLSLEPLDIQEGTLLLLRRAKRSLPDEPVPDVSAGQHEQANALAHLLGGLPLALEQAAAYLEETGCSIGQYLDLYQTRRDALLRFHGGTNHPQSVFATLSLSFAHLAHRHASAADILRLCAFLHPDAIPEDLLRASTQDASSPLQSLADPLAFNAALASLRAYSLLDRHPDTQTFSLHRLVQACLQDDMTEMSRNLWAECAVRAVNLVFPADGEEESSWPRCQTLLPHVDACFEVLQYRTDLPSEAARLFNEAGVYLREHAQYLRAEQLLQKALAIRLLLHGEEHLEIAESLTDLAVSAQQQGHYEQAEPLYVQALQIREHACEPYDPLLAESLNHLALFYYFRGLYAQAQPLMERALAIREQTLGPDHVSVAQSLNNLASLYRIQGEYQQAEVLYRRTLALTERTMGSEHSNVALSLNNLALTLIEQGRLTEAEALLTRALHISTHVFGTRHPNVALNFNNLGKVYAARQEYARAQQAYQQALSIREEMLGAEHPAVAASIRNLALLFMEQGHYQRARPLLERARDISERVLGVEHKTTQDIVADLEKLNRQQATLA